jgi:putative endonuclease
LGAQGRGRRGLHEEYGVKLLVYYETYPDVRDAIQREKNIKKWLRRWKLDLIRSINPEWRDLYEKLA